MKLRIVSLIVAVISVLLIFTSCGVVKNINGIITFVVDDDVYGEIKIDESMTSVEMPNDPTKEGFVFGGWFYDKNTWNKPFSLNSILNTPIANQIEVTLYAKWLTPEEAEMLNNQIFAFEEDTYYVAVGETVALQIKTALRLEDVAFTSSDSTIAKYFGGEVLGKSKGTCKITATTPNGTSVECTIVVGGKVVNTGKCGENVTWTYYDDNSLVFSGTGEMEEYYEDCWYQPSNVLIPWYAYSPMVKEIIIEEGITNIAAFAFIDCKNVQKISIPDSVVKIGHCAFEHWNNYEGFVLNKSVAELGKMVFHSCKFNVYYEGTEQDFNAIKVPSTSNDYSHIDRWNAVFNGNLLFYSETSQQGCWRYVDGVPTAW